MSLMYMRFLFNVSSKHIEAATHHWEKCTNVVEIITFQSQFSLTHIVLPLSEQKFWKSEGPYPQQVYTGWSSVHWNATGMQLVEPVYTGIPLGHPAITCRVHWNTTGKNLVETAPHWNATGETLTFAAYAGTPLEGRWQPTHAPTHLVKHAE